ncbi:MAG: type IX secretion system membrane protein PorP/SprF [Sphingobacteriaceae bacterium]|nr:type IX secretion system membrane protein PorP/SprF [Sphingobacteriaceae bacterium]
MNKKIFFYIFFCNIWIVSNAQENEQFSQYMFSGVYINPAYSGYKDQLNVHTFYRNQWLGIDGAPRSFSFAVDAPANNGKVGLSFIAGANRIGAQSSNWAYTSFAYKVRLGRNEDEKLSFGLSVGLLQNSIDGRKLRPEDTGDVLIPQELISTSLPDARLGVHYSNDKWYVGLSAENILAKFIKNRNRQINFFKNENPNYYLTAGVLLPINEVIQIKPSFLIKEDLDNSSAVDANLFFLIKDKIWIGTGYRYIKLKEQGRYIDNGNYKSILQSQKSIITMIEFFASEKIRLGYAYDKTLNDFSASTLGIHELSIGFYFKSKKEILGTPRRF